MILEIHYKEEVIKTIDLREVDRIKDLKFSVKMSSRVDDVVMTPEEISSPFVRKATRTSGIIFRRNPPGWKQKLKTKA